MRTQRPTTLPLREPSHGGREVRLKDVVFAEKSLPLLVDPLDLAWIYAGCAPSLPSSHLELLHSGVPLDREGDKVDLMVRGKGDRETHKFIIECQSSCISRRMMKQYILF